MYAIQNVKTGKFLYGTNYCYCPPHQRTSYNQMETYATLWEAQSDFLHRKCGKNYKIVVLETVKVKHVIKPPKSYKEVTYDD